MIYRVVDSSDSQVVLADINDVILAIYNFFILFLFIANVLYAFKEYNENLKQLFDAIFKRFEI